MRGGLRLHLEFGLQHRPLPRRRVRIPTFAASDRVADVSTKSAAHAGAHGEADSFADGVAVRAPDTGTIVSPDCAALIAPLGLANQRPVISTVATAERSALGLTDGVALSRAHIKGADLSAIADSECAADFLAKLIAAADDSDAPANRGPSHSHAIGPSDIRPDAESNRAAVARTDARAFEPGTVAPADADSEPVTDDAAEPGAVAHANPKSDKDPHRPRQPRAIWHFVRRFRPDGVRHGDGYRDRERDLFRGRVRRRFHSSDGHERDHRPSRGHWKHVRPRHRTLGSLARRVAPRRGSLHGRAHVGDPTVRASAPRDED